MFLSSHLMSEMELTADHLIVIGRGRILADMDMAQFIAAASGSRVQVVSPGAGELARLIAATDVSITSEAPGMLLVERRRGRHRSRRR